MQFEHPLTVNVVVTDDAQLRAVYAVLANPGIADALLLKNFWQTARNPNTDVGGKDHRETVEEIPAKQVSGAVIPGAEKLDLPNFTGDENSFLEIKKAVCAAADTSTVSDTAPIAGSDGSQNELDSAGIPFDESMHTGTKTKDGLWRMKKGVERPTATVAEPQPEETSQSAGDAGEASANDVEASSDDEDEFAAFRIADTEPTAPVEPLARTWTDADLGALCNQAAQKIGSTRVGEIKAKIAEFMPSDVVPHSRNVPSDRREEFAQAIEALAEIEFAG